MQTVGTDMDGRIAAVRRFNRFYTRRIGLLRDHHLGSPFSLAEARTLYELAQREQTSATELAATLGLDRGYLSRILDGFSRRGLLEKRTSRADARRTLLQLTPRGRESFGELDAGARAAVSGMVRGLRREDQTQLLMAMQRIEQILGATATPTAPVVLRNHRPGDIGWVIERHGSLYAHEYGWNEEFEALVAEIAAAFLRKHDPKRERCWIAEQDGERVGTVFLVARSPTVAQLRLLLVEPRARGAGLGRRLVDECTRFARRAGYRKIILWTNSVLGEARRIYERAGYRLVHEGPHHSFGQDLIEQTWEKRLVARRTTH